MVKNLSLPDEGVKIPNLNSLDEYIRAGNLKIPLFKEYFLEGGNVNNVPKLLKDNRNPMSMAHIMQRRFDLRNGPAEVKTAWIDNFFDTPDLCARKEDEVKLVLTTYADGSITPLGERYLSLINPKERLVNGGAVNLGIEDRYENLDGEGIITTKRGKLAKIIHGWLTEQQANDSLFWKVGLRHPDYVPAKFAIPGLHKEVIHYIFSERKNRFGHDDAMDVSIILRRGKSIPELRMWSIWALHEGSHASNMGFLNHDGCRLIGKYPKC